MRFINILIVIALSSLWSCTNEPKPIQRVNEDKFNALTKEYRGAMIVDLRDADSYAKEHMKGAINLPADDALYDKLYQLSTRQVYLMYCADGETAKSIIPMLEELRFQQVYLLREGWEMKN